jgi:hypothetical protein
MARTTICGDWLVLLLCGALASTPALADVSPITSIGTPVMVVPQYQETGAPTFTSPNGSTMFPGSTSSTTSDPTSSDPTSSSGSGGGSVATNYSQYLNQYVGSGQCVALVQTADSSVGLTATWTQGSAVQGDTSLQPGTAIATFGPNGTYTNSTDGSSHAAIYLGQNAQGIQVEDQWLGQERPCIAARGLRGDHALFQIDDTHSSTCQFPR